MIYDEEDLLKSLRTYVKANLNTKIAAINTEKNDFPIDQITADDDHYVISGELLDWPNHTFVSFAIAGEIEAKNNRGNKISIPSITVEVAFDNPQKPNIYYKSLRYMRALYETILEYEASVIETGDLVITKLIPMIVPAEARRLVVSGVNVSVSIS